MKKASGKKRRFRFVKYLLLSVFSFIFLLILIAEVFEKKITALAFEKIKESVNIPMEVNDISFTLLRRFPLATIELKDIILSSPADSAGMPQDTLISVGKVYFSVKSLPLIDEVFDIQKVEVIGANIRFFRNKEGKSNFDFLIDTTSTTGTDTVFQLPDITLQNLLVEDMVCYYSDSATSTKARINIPGLELRGKVQKNIYSGFVKGSVDVSKADFENTNLDRMRNTSFDFDIAYINDSLSVNHFVIVSDGIKMNIMGTALIQNDISADINISSEEVDLAELLKYVPADTLKKYGIKSVSGRMTFNAKIRGVVSDTSVMPSVDADMWLKNAGISVKDYPAFKNISFNIAFTNGEKQDETTSEINVKNLHFETANSKGFIKGSIKNLNDPRYSVKGDLNVDLSEFSSFVPDSLLSSIDGNFKAVFSTKGVFPDSVTDAYVDKTLKNSFADVTLTNVNAHSDSFPDVTSLTGKLIYKPGSFEVKDLFASLPDYHLNLSNCTFKTRLEGELTDPSKTIFDIQSFFLQTDSSSISGKAYVEDLESPRFRFNADVNLNLAEAMSVLPEDSIVTDMSGNVMASVASTGHLNPDSITEQLSDIIFRNSSFNAQFSKVSVEMPDTLICISNLSGKMTLVHDSLSFQDVEGNYKSITFNVPEMNIVNVYDAVLLNKKEKVTAEGVVQLGDIDYAMFAPFVEDTSVTKENDAPEEINYSFVVKGKISANSFKYKKAVFKDISALYKLTDSVYIIEKFNFDAFGGKASNSVRLNYMPDGTTIINTKHSVNRVDIHQVLNDFDDFKEFGNNEISADNLGGLFSTTLHTKVVMAGDSILENETRIKGDLKMEDGGIYNYKAAMDMADFTKLKELDSIRFKTFESKIFMFKDKLYVPNTYIVSSALDIGFFGMQSMGEDYEYHIQLHLGDVLKGKSQKLLKRQAENGDEVTAKDFDRSTVKLIYANINGKSKVGFDKKKAQRLMQVKIKTQEKMLDLIFFPKLVSFDTGVEN